MARMRWCQSAKGPQDGVCVYLACIALAVGCSFEESTGPTDVAGPAAGARAAAGAQPTPAGGRPTLAGNPATPASGAGGQAAPEPAKNPVAPAPAPAPVGGAPAAVRSTGPGDWKAGDYPPNLMAETYLEIRGVPGQNDLVRQYKVHVPPGYDPNVPAPAVFCLHGLLQNPVSFCVTATGWTAKSDEEGFVLIMPNGYMGSWNGGTCCDPASGDRPDDVALFRAILEEVGKHANIDLDRVFATGLSNGGYMSMRLVCEAADLFRAVAVGAGAVGINSIGGGTTSSSDFTMCAPSRPVSVLAVHGSADALIPYDRHEKSMKLLAERYGCSTRTQPAGEPRSAGDTTCVSHEGCPNGIELTGCTIKGGGHCWFGSDDCGTGAGATGLTFVGANSNTMRNTDAAWSFFERVAR